MKFTIENVGPIQKSEMEFGKLTILCGKNNTGKTYITYNTFNFFDAIRYFIKIQVDKSKSASLLETGKVSIDLSNYYKGYPALFKKTMDKWVKDEAGRQMASHQNYYSQAKMFLDFDHDEFFEYNKMMHFNATPLITKDCILHIDKKENETIIDFTIENTGSELPDKNVLQNHIESFLSFVINSYFPDTFIITCERTGVACFRPSFICPPPKGRIVERKNNYDVDAPRYPRPMQKDWRFVVEFNDTIVEKSYIAEKHPNILKYFSEICGGDYSLDNNNVLFEPQNAPSVQLTTTESSSTVRSLMELNFYLKHKARPFQVLIVDEPELNLHPENQRKMARLLAMLVNAGIYVAITTHSDYIIRELNTLIMLNNQQSPRLQAIAKELGYDEEHFNCLLLPEQIRCYVAENGTIKPMNVDGKYGIEVTIFDDSIREVNALQRRILYGE